MKLIPALLLSAVISGNATAADPNLGRNLAAGCANCHGTGGKVVAGTLELNGLAGEPKAKLLEKIANYRSGEKPATVMHQIAKGYTDAQLEAIATWFAAQAK
jgi:sulfide dehydrogenase cytochrome subunit